MSEKKTENSEDQLLFQQLRDCKNLKEIIVREDLISGFTSKLMARSLSEEMDESFGFIPGERGTYYHVVVK